MHRSRVKRACLAGALAFVLVSARAASACDEDAIYNQAYAGRVTSHFSVACLQQARRDESAEVRMYHDIDGPIVAAILAVTHGRQSALPGLKPRHLASVTSIVSPPRRLPPIASLLALGSPSRADAVPPAVIALGGFTGLFLLGGVASALLRRRLQR
jgi:hypothetical protein